MPKKLVNKIKNRGAWRIQNVAASCLVQSLLLHEHKAKAFNTQTFLINQYYYAWSYIFALYYIFALIHY